jgi:cytochrome c biogenesis protein CcmG/thiol:disulfide interchange protein DsbE
MKKTVLIVIGVLIVIVVAAHFADKATRLPRGPQAANEVKADTAEIGKPAPDLTLKNLDGKDVSIAEYKGKVVLVNFWATWCDPCREEIPWLIEMQEKYQSRGFTVLGLAMDEEGKSVVAPFVAKEHFDVNGTASPMNYPILIGDEAAGDKFGGLFGLPTSVLIDRDGKQIKRITGIISYADITKLIEAKL